MADGDPLVLGLGSNASNAATELNRAGRIHNTALTVHNGNGSAIEGQAGGRDAGVTGRADLGEGLRGLATNGLGVFGQSDTWVAIHGLSQDHAAIAGFSKNSYGAAGASDGAGDGVLGAAEGTGNGVIGWSLQNRGVWGTAALAPGVGVDGISPNIGVRGVGAKTGVHGQGKDTGVGVQAVATNNDALVASSGTKRGVVGLTQSGSGVGVHGVAFPPGAAPGTGHTGVMGSTAAGFGLFGTANTGYAGGFAGHVIIWGNLTVIGTKSAAVPHPDGSHRLTYCTESPESWFEDFGRARLAHGSAEVQFDPDFAAIVRTKDFHVFLTPEGETEGLYVSRRGQDGFEVREQRGGTSDATFSYRVVARRRDVDAARLAVIELPQTPPVPDMPEIALPEIPEAPTSPRAPVEPARPTVASTRLGRGVDVLVGEAVSIVDGVAVHYREFGQCMPALILHGAGVDHREMAAALEPLFAQRPDYRRIYMDSPGMGGTSADTVNSNDDVLDLVIGFARDVIGDDKFLVVGHSYGGYLARAVARRCRQVAGLALVSTAGDERGEVPERVVLHARASWKVGLTSRTKVSSAATSSCRRGDAAAVP